MSVQLTITYKSSVLHYSWHCSEIYSENNLNILLLFFEGVEKCVCLPLSGQLSLKLAFVDLSVLLGSE